MINELYNDICIALAAILFVLGLMFAGLRGSIESAMFRKALLLMAVTYGFFGLVNAVELRSRTVLPEGKDALLFQMATLIVAVSQAFMFTYTLILLIHSAYVTRKRVVCEIVPIFTLSAALAVACLTLPDAWVSASIRLFILFYAGLLIKYTRLFITTYRDCLRKMDNFFSGQEAGRLRWVNFSFYAALSIGLMALASAMFPAVHISIACSVICLLFYTYFAIRFINYAFVYNKMEEALADDTGQPVQPAGEDKNTLLLSVANTLKSKIQRWIEENRFVQPGVTIEEAARQIGTNRSYLSQYINTAEGKTFRQWINELRIEYAKNLMDQNPGLELSQIVERTGFPTHSQFSSVFKKITGKTPIEYRNK
jgi:AraC-like DNA-binding protein